MSDRSPIHEKAAIGFERAADAYDRGRPDYPEEAIRFISDRLFAFRRSQIHAVSVVDLAAGTGKFTKILARLTPDPVAQIKAVEPVAAMRAKLQSLALANVEISDGTAERIPCEDLSIDVVTVAQAFHWFNGEAALAEIHRVLKPGGLLAVLWNVRDGKFEWIREMTSLMKPYEDQAPRFESMNWRHAFDSSKLFTPLEPTTFKHVAEGSFDTMLDRVASVSFVAALSDGDRGDLLSRMLKLYERVNRDNGEPPGRLAMPYETRIYLCRK